MSESDGWFLQELETRGVSRRDFMGFCSAMAAVLALPRTAAAAHRGRDPEDREAGPRLARVPGLRGNTESFLRASRPTAAEIVLDTLSVDYHETIMAAAGHQAEEALAKTVKERAGALPRRRRGLDPDRRQRRLLHDRRPLGAADRPRGLRQRGGHHRDGHLRHLRRVCPPPPRTRPAPWASADAVPGVKNLINLSACPANVENLTALIVYFLTFKRWPPLDAWRRPLFAYGKSIHDNCERRAHFDAGQYVEDWGDEGAPHGVLPLQDGLQGAGHLPELPERPLERRHQLADRLRASLHRLRGARLLGQDDALLRSTSRACPASAWRRTSTRSGSGPRSAWARPSPPTASCPWPSATGRRSTTRRPARRPRKPSAGADDDEKGGQS